MCLIQTLLCYFSVNRKDIDISDSEDDELASLSPHTANYSQSSSSPSSHHLESSTKHRQLQAFSGKLPDIFNGVSVYFYKVSADRIKKLKRYLIAYPFTCLS